LTTSDLTWASAAVRWLIRGVQNEGKRARKRAILDRFEMRFVMIVEELRVFLIAVQPIRNGVTGES
jgi:hypothetical protein